MLALLRLLVCAHTTKRHFALSTVLGWPRCYTINGNARLCALTVCAGAALHCTTHSVALAAAVACVQASMGFTALYVISLFSMYTWTSVFLQMVSGRVEWHWSAQAPLAHLQALLLQSMCLVYDCWSSSARVHAMRMHP
jgi:hypothetical protein